MSLARCVYATSDWGIHDARWTDALRTVGFQPDVVRLGIDAASPTVFRELVARAAGPNMPILAGPLDLVTAQLVGIDSPVIGLSWGFDLHTMSDRSWLSKLHGLIVDSEATAHLATSAGVSSKRITFLPWGVDLDQFSHNGPRADLTAWGVPESARTVLSLRSHEPLYRVPDILEGFAQASSELSDVHLLVGHSGSLTEQLRAQANALGIHDRTHFIGSIPEEDLPALLRASDLYVSASEVDGTSVTLLQAMACGTPVLTSDTAGNRPWVQPGVTGFLFQTGDPGDLRSQLLKVVLAGTHDTKLICANAQALVRRQADWKSNIQRLADALNSP